VIFRVLLFLLNLLPSIRRTATDPDTNTTHVCLICCTPSNDGAQNETKRKEKKKRETRIQSNLQLMTLALKNKEKESELQSNQRRKRK